MGKYALRVLGAERHFGMKVTVACSGKPPQSCIVDGLQISTGATYGKRTIIIVESPEIEVTIVDKQSGEKMVFSLTEKAKSAMAAMGKDSDEVERTARFMASWKDEELFSVVRDE